MGIFDTTANTQANAFSDPLNPVNLNRGGWGMDPNYLTPAFSAPYRPPYTGADSHIANQNPGFFRSMGGAMGMGPNAPYGVGDDAQQQAYFDALSGKTQDGVAAFGQRFVMPIASFAAANSLSKMWQVRTNNSVQQKAMYNWAYATGRSPAGAGAYAAKQSIFTAVGERAGTGFGMGIARGLGLETAGAAGIAARGLGAAAGFVSGAALPLLAAQGAMALGNNMVFDQYTGLRENQQSLRNTFQNVTFAGAQGTPITGRGLGRGEAGGYATQLGKAGAEDQNFNSREIATMTSMAGQMGMLDSVGSDQIVNRMKSIMKQMKIVMSVAQTTDFKEAMQLMARVTAAGASNTSASSVLAGIGSMASVAGISTGRMMNTVGNQGQYLFQANGMTPVLGQTAGATAMGGLASAYRSGLISPDLLARLGGMEGATQLSVTGQLNASQSTYNQMKAFNRFTLGQNQSGVVNNVMAYGQAAARNPLEAMGASILDRTMNLSSQMSKDGQLRVTHDQIMDIANVMPGATKNGRVSANAAAAIMSKMGMNEQEIQAYLTQYAGAVDPKSREQFKAGMESQQRMTTVDYLNRTGQNALDSWGANPASWWRASKSAIVGGIGYGVEKVSGGFDSANSAFQKFSYGDNIMGRRANDGETTSRFQMGVVRHGVHFKKEGGMPAIDSDETRSTMEKINDLAADGDPNAAILTSKGAGVGDRKTALARLIAANKLDKSVLQNSDNVIFAAHTVGKIETKGKPGAIDEFNSNMDKAIGSGVFRENATYADVNRADIASQSLINMGLDGIVNGKGDDFKRLVSTLQKTTGMKSDNPLDIYKKAKDVSKVSRDNKLTLMDVYGGANPDELRKLADTDPSKVFKKGSKHLEAFKNAKTEQEKMKAVTDGYAELTNAIVTAPGTYGGKNLTDEDRAQMGEQLRHSAVAQQHLDDLAKNGKIDIGQYTFATAANSMNDAVNKFGNFVEQFGRSTQVKPEATPAETGGPQVGWRGEFNRKLGTNY